MEKDVFCKIIDGEIPSKVVYEDEYIEVIMDRSQNPKGNMLIIPKNHITDALDMDDETFKRINSVLKDMILKCYNNLGATGVEIVQNNGTCQEVKHYHIHIFPKYNKQIELTDEEVYKKLIEK